jgi:hypothetical protein
MNREKMNRSQSEILDEINTKLTSGDLPEIANSLIEGEVMIISANDDSGNPMRIAFHKENGMIWASFADSE